MRKILLFSAIAALLTLVPVREAQGQDVLEPTWTRGAVDVPMQFSRDGGVVMAHNNGGVRAWDTATNKMICSIGVASNGQVIESYGLGFFYSSGDRARIFYYDSVKRVASSIKVDGTQYGIAQALALSSDGKKLAYVTTNNTTGRETIVTIDAQDGATLSRWALPAGLSCAQIAWVNGDQRILIGGMPGTGMRLYTNLGVQVVVRSTFPNWFTVSPDTLNVYTRDDGGNLAALKTAGSLTTKWSVPSDIDPRMRVSSDGRTLLARGMDDAEKYYGIRQYSTENGALLGGSLNVSEEHAVREFAVDPASNIVMLFSYTGGASIQRWSFDSDSGDGSRLADLEARGPGVKTESVGIPSVPVTVTDDPWNLVYDMFNAANASMIRRVPRSPVVFSPHGTHYIQIGQRPSDGAVGAHVYRTSDNAWLASSLGSDIQTAGWSTSTNTVIWTWRTTNVIRTMAFDGANLNLISEISGPNTGDVKINAGNTRTAFYGNNFNIYDTVTGALTGTIDRGDSFTGAVRWGFCGDILWVYDWGFNGATTYTCRLRFYFVQNTPLLLNTISFDQEWQPYDVGTAAVSDDGSIAVMGRSMGQDGKELALSEMRVYRVVDGALLKRYDRNFTDWAIKSTSISKDNVTFCFVGSDVRTLVGAELPAILQGFSLAPGIVVGGNSATGTLLLNRPAPAGGIVVSVSAPGLIVPATVTVAAGALSAQFSVGTTGVDTMVTRPVTVSYGGLSRTESIDVYPPTVMSIAFVPSSVDGGQSSVGTITLNGKAGPSGFVVSLSSDKSYVTVPGAKTVDAGASTATFTATTTDPGTSGIATVTGVRGAVTGSGTLQVYIPGASVQFVESAVKGGNALTLRITLLAQAPAGGAAFNLAGDSLSNPVPQFTVPAGATTFDLGVDTNATLVDAATTVTVTPASGGGGPKTATAMVKAPIFVALTAVQTVVAGAKTIKVQVSLDGIAPAGLSYAVSSSSAFITVPASVTVPAGEFSVNVDLTVKKTATAKSVKITIGSKIITILLKANP
ncbi:MAG: hypothetical protein ACAH95_16145 [Fimbriimonas sp.]